MLLKDLGFPQAGKRPQAHGLLMKPIGGRLNLALGSGGIGNPGPCGLGLLGQLTGATDERHLEAKLL